MANEAHKIKLLVLWDILCKNTDENHALNTDEISELLALRGLNVSRKILVQDIATLCDNGYEVLSYKKKYHYYYVVNRSLETAEVVMLADVINASKLPVAQKKALAQRLAETLCTHQAESISKHIISLDKGRRGNSSFIYNVDAIERAINENKQISFLYFNYDEKHKKVYRKNGNRYTVSPAFMVWNKDNYYLLCFSKGHDDIVTYRLDKMESVKVEELERESHPEYELFNTEEYRKQVFSMFGGESQNITLLFTANILSDMFDRFGDDIRIKKADEETYSVDVTVQISKTFFAWIVGTQGKVKIKSPRKVIDEFILMPFNNCRVYDPCCGSGGMFVQSVKFLQAHCGNRGGISVFGQESNADTWKMAKMNMAIRGIDADLGPYNRDTFFDDLHPTLKADFIMANPPFNLSNWGQDKLKDDKRWKYGTPPAGNANFAWIQHMIYHLAPRGKIGLVLANGALSSQSSGEGEIRKNIIEDDLIEGIVALPTQLFYSVTIPVTLWFITKGKKQPGKTVFIDARKMGHMVDRKHRDFSEEDINKIADTFAAFQNGTLEDVKGFCAVKTTADIAAQDYILTPGRYVGIEEQEDDGEPFEEKMTRLTSELSEMFKKSHELEDEIRKKLGAIGYEI